MIKVLEVCTVSSSAYALVANRVQALNQHYAGRMQVELLCTDGAEVSLMRAKGIPVITATLHRSMNPAQLLRSAWNLRRVIQQGNYGIIHLHFGIPGLVGRFLAFFMRNPVWIYQSHGYSITENTHPFARRAYIWVEKLLKHTVRYSLFQLREDIALAKQYQLLEEQQIIHIGNGIDLETFTPSTIPSKPTHSPLVFGMVARFESVKNHALLLDAVTLLAKEGLPFHVKLIGQGHLQAELQSTIRTRGLENFVTIEAYRNDMPTFYRNIDVAVLTSFFEGIPRALIEPMACGKPVICTNVKGSREAVIDQKTGFKTPLDQPEILAGHMRWFIQHPQQRQQMGIAARAHALQQFNEKKIIDQLGELYLSCGTPQHAEETHDFQRGY
jgi:glycosyltransferase involved in cell wall biosynthesis